MASFEDVPFNGTNCNCTTSLLDDFFLFITHLSTDPAKAIDELPHVAGALLGTLIMPILLWILVKSLMGERKVNALANWRPKSLVEEAEELTEAAVDAPIVDEMFDVGVSGRAIAVSEDGVLRAFETLPSGQKKATAIQIAAVLVKAMARPMDEQPVHRPHIAAFLHSRQCSNDVVADVAKRLKKFDVKVGAAEQLSSEIEEYAKKRQEETVKQSAAQKPANLDENGKPVFISAPKRGCFVCKNEIEGKASQCSACKAIIYCSPECAKKDWTTHKQACPVFKAYMSRIDQENLHDFPFDYYNDKIQLHAYNQVNFLIHNDVHNVGVFRRLCHCYSQVPYGELAAQQLAQLQVANVQDPLERFKLFGLSMQLYPLSAPYPEGTNLRDIDSWKKFYELRNIPMSDPAALVLEVPMTLWHLINKYALDNIAEVEGRRQITIHLLGAEKEADLTALFEVLLSLLPKTDIAVHMISPAISPRLPGPHATLGIRNETMGSTILITLRPGMYSPEQYSGEAYKTDGLPFGTGKPDLVVIMNSGLLASPTWGPALKLLIENGQKTLMTEEMEHTAELIGKQLVQIGCPFTVEPVANPFRQPVFLWKKDTNLPGWSNGFIFGFN
ncbi:hypothetical protein SpCBS45565_g03449 [Spizellomyces sp. 'palustris']|nr:hypothetical protein SpCBS45565_g03449 [Spizellomyces sp. 'palustris']